MILRDISDLSSPAPFILLHGFLALSFPQSVCILSLFRGSSPRGQLESYVQQHPLATHVHGPSSPWQGHSIHGVRRVRPLSSVDLVARLRLTVAGLVNATEAEKRRARIDNFIAAIRMDVARNEVLKARLYVRGRLQ